MELLFEEIHNATIHLDLNRDINRSLSLENNPFSSSSPDKMSLIDKIGWRQFDQRNHMANYTFYKKETHLMFATNIATAAMVVVGLLSNITTLGVLGSEVFSRTSLPVYLKWICAYNIMCLLMSLIRQHSFLLDFEDKGHQFRENRYFACAWLLWFHLELEHCTAACFGLLIWNRIWCSFSFIHRYGAPALQENTLHNVTLTEHCVILASLLILMVEMTLRAFRDRKHVRKLRISDLVGRLPTSSRSSSASSETTGVVGEQSMRFISKARLRSTPQLTYKSSMMAKDALGVDDEPSDKPHDKHMSQMALVYILLYVVMVVPDSMVHYFIEKDNNDFPMVMMISLLRQAFQAGTIFILCMASNLFRTTVNQLTGQNPSFQRSSSNVLFEADKSMHDLDMWSRRSTMWLPSAERSRTKFQSYNLAGSVSAPGRLDKLDKLELGLNYRRTFQSRPTLLMAKRSQSQTTYHDSVDQGYPYHADSDI